MLFFLSPFLPIMRIVMPHPSAVPVVLPFQTVLVSPLLFLLLLVFPVCLSTLLPSYFLAKARLLNLVESRERVIFTAEDAEDIGGNTRGYSCCWAIGRIADGVSLRARKGDNFFWLKTRIVALLHCFVCCTSSYCVVGSRCIMMVAFSYIEVRWQQTSFEKTSATFLSVVITASSMPL